jgi:hypothetical protein
VKQQIAWSSDCLPQARFDFPKRVQLGRSWLTKQSVPRVGSNAYYAREISFDVTETNCPEESREISTECPDGRTIGAARVDRRHEKDRGLC